MKNHLRNWFKGHKVLRVMLPVALVLVMVMVLVVPFAYATVPTYPNVVGAYTISKAIPAKYLTVATHTPMSSMTLVITTQTSQTISAATLITNGETLALTGLVGSSTNPYISLQGTDSDGSYVFINGKVTVKSSVVTGISGNMQGFVTSDGERWDLSDTGTATIYNGANSYGGAGYCALLTAGAGAGAECVQFNRPVNTFKLKDLDTLVASTSKGLSFYYNLENAKSPGVQIGLRFAPVGVTGTDLFTSIAHVDITIAPFYSTTGDGTWKKYTVTKDSARIYYYGNAPDDHAGFSQPGDYLATLSLAEAAINAESEMLNGTPASASNWVLTAIYIDLYEAGARTCYIDSVQIGNVTYTLEPFQFGGTFTATKL